MHFDGFLINVECALTPAEVAILLEWLSVFRAKLKLRIPHSLLIWYDAVTIEGQLVWQNALNAKNQPFFDVCDAIFLNYAWDQTAASSSAFAAGNRTCDVFLGVDVFGRGTFGGGKFNSHAASAIAQVHCRFCYRAVSVVVLDALHCPGIELQSGSVCARLDARVHSRWNGH
jgi:endo-beta-N-acetylglucosaminidase D